MGPLDGLQVIEIAGLGPVPFAAMMLADMGASVIRIDRLAPSAGGIDSRLTAGADRQPINRGRRSIAANLRDPRGQEIVLRMVERSDALIEGFRPGVVERLGIGPEQCHARNPRLVYGRMTGWGQQGPLASSVGHDINYIAVAGALANFARVGQPPIAPLNLVGDYGGGGMLLAFGVLCGVIEAQRSGEGQVVDAAMIDGVAAMLVNVYGRLAQGEWREPPGTNHVDSGSPWYDVYETADGRYLAVGAMEVKFYRTFVEGLGLVVDQFPQWDRARWPEQKAEVARRLMTRSRDEWCREFDGKEACVAPVLGLAEAPEHPHNRSREMFVTRDGVVQPSPAPRFSRTPPELPGPPTGPGADTDAILDELGFSAAEVDGLRGDGVVAGAPAVP
jgi:alpha-methylacyl-CoA racemase